MGDSRPDVRFKPYIAFLNIAEAPCESGSSKGSDGGKHDPRCVLWSADPQQNHGASLESASHQKKKFPGGLVNELHNVEDYKFKKGYLEVH